MNQEWTGSSITAGTGVPNNVFIRNNTTVNMPNTVRGMAGNLNIAYGTLQMNAAFGADLSIAGNWTRKLTIGIFNPNTRAVSFKGSANQTVSITGGGTEKFNYLIIDKPNAATYVKPDNTVGNLTDIIVNGTSSNILQIINNGSIDLNGRAFSLDGNNSGGSTGNFYVNGARVVTNTAAGGINAGSFAIMSSANPNQPSWYTKSVANNAGVGTLTFDQNVLVTIADGRMDWGLDALNVNITTIQGVLQINLGGSVAFNSCYYSSTPASTLRFANTIDYQVNASDKTWASGAIYSGLPGIPWNVEVNNTNTDLTINDVRALRNNLSITDGRLTLIAGPFNIGGNWTRTNPAGITVPPCVFVPNSNKVVFDKTGAGDQSITCTANSNVETFYDLDISPATVNVALGGSTSVTVTNNLLFTSGKVDMNGNTLTIGTTSADGSITGANSSNYVLAYKAAVNGTLKRFTNNIATTYLFPVGDNTSYTPVSVYLNSATLSSPFITTQLNAVMHPNKGTVTTYLKRYWAVTPSGITNPNYNIIYNYVAADVVGTEANLFPFKYNGTWIGSGGSGAFFMLGTGSVNTGTKTLTWNNVVSFSDFTGLGNEPSNTLPISLLSFEAHLIDNDAQLKWVTSSEKNNDYFTLLRSWDGEHFEEINKQKGAGNSVFNLNYFYTDKGIASSGKSVVYYQLKQTDFNGQFSYSKKIAISLNTKNDIALKCYPNPFSKDFELSFIASKEGDAQLEMFASNGKQLLEKTIAVQEGENHFTLSDASDFSSGFYFIKLTFDTKVFRLKMIKE